MRMTWGPRPTEGGKFTIEDLANWETWVTQQVHYEAGKWLRGIWKWLLLVLVGAWTRDKLSEFLRRTKNLPETSAFDIAIRAAWEIGTTEAAADIERTTPPTGGPPKMPPKTPPEKKLRANALLYARTSAALKMREWADGMRDDVRWQVVRAIQEGVSPDVLAQRLEARWEHYGQNFQMIAVTELNDAFNSGYLLSLPEGSYVTVPPINDDRVCPACKELLEGKVFEVLHHPPVHLTRQVLETALWPGKSNIGRKREDWVPCVGLHPNCRHRVVFFSGKPIARR